MTLTDHVLSYVSFKRGAGQSSQKEPERLLRSFALHAEARGDRFVRVETALAWASQTTSPEMSRKRLHYVCGLAAFLHAGDERHEVPHRDALGRKTRHRPPPRTLSLPQTRQLMEAALQLPPPESITPVTFPLPVRLARGDRPAAFGSRRTATGGSHAGRAANPPREVRPAAARAPA